MAPRRKKPSDKKEDQNEEQSKRLKEDTEKTAVKEGSTEAGTSSTRVGRGRTHMHCLAIQRAQGLKYDVEFNVLGQPIGSFGKKMQSYIGVLAREKVKISYNNWKKVPQDVKDLIWDSVNMSFNVHQGWKVECLKSAAQKWRQFKTELTNNYVYARLNSPDLKCPPSKFPFIQQADWTDFIVTRLTDNFKANLWVEGRKTKGGEHQGDELMGKVAKIREFISDKESGSLESDCLKGSILDTALEKKEHSGFLRGLGGHASKCSLSKVATANHLYMEQQHELKSMKLKSSVQEDRISKLEALLLKVSGDEKASNFKGSQSVHKPEQSRTPDDDFCEIQIVDREFFKYLELDTNIVAYGTVVQIHDSDADFDINFMKVAIDEALVEDAHLPVPENDRRSIIDSVGSHVLWPKHLLRLRDEKTHKKKKEKRMRPSIDLSSVPKSLRVVYSYLRAALEGVGTIQIQPDVDMFGLECSLFLHVEDAEPFCQLLPISYTCIVVYVWWLFKKMQELEKTELFRFVDPSHGGHVQSKKNYKLTEKMEAKSKFIGNRLIGTLPNQIVLVPCNVGDHWILTVIDPHKEEIGILDPLYKGIHNNTWKEVVEVALRLFIASKNVKVRKTPKWSVIKVPKQPDAFQCGYYVMKYMREIIHSDAIVTIDGLQSLFKDKLYDVEDIDNVRTEWAELVQDYMY